METHRARVRCVGWVFPGGNPAPLDPTLLNLVQGSSWKAQRDHRLAA